MTQAPEITAAAEYLQTELDAAGVQYNSAWPLVPAGVALMALTKCLKERDAARALLVEAGECLREQRCIRPCNNRPDDFLIGQCADAAECGCGAADLSRRIREAIGDVPA